MAGHATHVSAGDSSLGQDSAIVHTACIACGGSIASKLAYKTRSVSQCSSCGLQLQVPQPSDRELAEIYGTYYFIGSDDEVSKARKLALKQSTSQLYLDIIDKYRGTRGSDLLEVGCGQGEFLVEALRRGYAVTGVEYSDVACATARQSLAAVSQDSGKYRVERGEVESAALSPGSFDTCVMNDVIEHVRDPRKTMARVRELVKPGGVVFIATPSLDSWSAKLMGKLWMEYKDEHLFYFSKQSLVKLFENTGFGKISFVPGYKILTLEYVAQHFEKFPVPGFSPLVRGSVGLLPKSVSRRPIKIVASGIIALATAV